MTKTANDYEIEPAYISIEKNQTIFLKLPNGQNAHVSYFSGNNAKSEPNLSVCVNNSTLLVRLGKKNEVMR